MWKYDYEGEEFDDDMSQTEIDEIKLKKFGDLVLKDRNIMVSYSFFFHIN